MASIVIPWRDDGTRGAICDWVCEMLRRQLPDAAVMLVDSGHEPFNRAASRNLGVSRVPLDEVVIVSDADVILDHAWDPGSVALSDVINRAISDGRLHYPFTTCNYLTAKMTAAVLCGRRPDQSDLEFSIHVAQGGLMVIRADAWRSTGGMDERFMGWGYEDNEWHTRVERVIGSPVRHRGVLWHLHHPSDRNRGTVDELGNLALARGTARG